MLAHSVATKCDLARFICELQLKMGKLLNLMANQSRRGTATGNNLNITDRGGSVGSAGTKGRVPIDGLTMKKIRILTIRRTGMARFYCISHVAGRRKLCEGSEAASCHGRPVAFANG
jgi:hypothetical protein